MTEPVLHHYPVSPFAEKARAMLGFKGLAPSPSFYPQGEFLASFGKDRSAYRQGGTVHVHFPRFGFQLNKPA